MNDLVEKLKAGKKAMAERCRDVAAKLAEEAGVVTVQEDRRRLAGRANAKDRRISVPPPTTRRRLYVFAHECGHVLLGHDGRKTRHREEYEAERWAHDALRRHGIRVSRRSSHSAKKYVRRRITEAFLRGSKRIDPEAAKWSGWSPSSWWYEHDEWRSSLRRATPFTLSLKG